MSAFNWKHNNQTFHQTPSHQPCFVFPFTGNLWTLEFILKFCFQSQTQNRLVVAAVYLKAKGERTFQSVTPRLWSSFVLEVFKKKLKTIFFSDAFISLFDCDSYVVFYPFFYTIIWLCFMLFSALWLVCLWQNALKINVILTDVIVCYLGSDDHCGSV